MTTRERLRPPIKRTQSYRVLGSFSYPPSEADRVMLREAPQHGEERRLAALREVQARGGFRHVHPGTPEEPIILDDLPEDVVDVLLPQGLIEKES